jgi:hypothetical protein
MAIDVFGYLHAFYLFCIIFPICVFYIYKKYHSILNIKIVAFIFIFISITYLIVTSVFPIPVQHMFIENWPENVPNIFNPFERAYKLYLYWIQEKYPLHEYVLYNLYFWISNLCIYSFIGFSIRTIFCQRKSAIIISGSSLLIQLIPFSIGILFIGKNYKPINVERSMLLLIGGFLGLWIYKLFKRLVYDHHEKSNILSSIYHIAVEARSIKRI